MFRENNGRREPRTRGGQNTHRTKKRGIWPVFYGILLIAFTVYTGLDTFVISRTMAAVPQSSGTEIAAEGTTVGASGGAAAEAGVKAEAGTGAEAEEDSGADTVVMTSEEAGTTDTSDAALAENVIHTYDDENMSITLSEYREYNTTIYVADVSLTSQDYLRTAFAQSSYGRNVTAKTSEIAESVGAVLAVNGDFYGARERGYVIRNGVIYRDTAVSGQEDLVIYSDGSFGIINESDVSAQELLEAGAVQVLSFGPALIEDGQIAVSAGEEVGRAMASNPRTAIAVTKDGHYLFVVSDGRTGESEGLSLSQMAEFLQSFGVETAYNLDGGGSSAMVFEGEVINHPTTGGSRIKERKVSDIVYIG